jgi:hypothetical protein
MKEKGRIANMSTINIRELELVYRNAETQEELDLALQFHGITYGELSALATDRGWQSSPIAVKNLAAQIDSFDPTVEADDKFIESSNKASIRRLHSLLEYTVTKFHLEARDMSIAAMADTLDVLVKIREKLTKLELPLYGLSTMEPVVVANPIHVFLDTEADDECKSI